MLEIIICIFIVGIVLSISISKFDNITNASNVTKLKSQLALIRLGISKQESKNILLNKSKSVLYLDDAPLNVSGVELFTNVIDFVIFSTNTLEKKSENWAKISNNRYVYYLNSQKILFIFENNLFICNESKNICKDFD